MKKYKPWYKDFESFSFDSKRKAHSCKRGIFKNTRKIKPPKKNRISKDEVFEYIKSHNIQTRNQLKKQLLKDNDAPSLYYVDKYFGSWTNLKNKIFFNAEVKFKQSDKAIAILIATYELWTRDKYTEKRKKNKQLFPSLYEIYKRFGSYENAIRYSRIYSQSDITERYIEFALELGHCPTISECNYEGIELEMLKGDTVKIKRDLDIIVKTLRGKLNENK